MKARIMQLACAGICVATMLKCLVQREKRGRYRQRVYAERFISYMSEAVKHCFGSVCR